MIFYTWTYAFESAMQDLGALASNKNGKPLLELPGCSPGVRAFSARNSMPAVGLKSEDMLFPYNL